MSRLQTRAIVAPMRPSMPSYNILKGAKHAHSPARIALQSSRGKTPASLQRFSSTRDRDNASQKWWQKKAFTDTDTGKRLGPTTTAFAQWSRSQVYPATQTSTKGENSLNKLELQLGSELALRTQSPPVARVVGFAFVVVAGSFAAAALYTVTQAHDTIERVEKAVEEGLKSQQEQWRAQSMLKRLRTEFPTIARISIWLPEFRFLERWGQREAWASRFAGWWRDPSADADGHMTKATRIFSFRALTLFLERPEDHPTGVTLMAVIPILAIVHGVGAVFYADRKRSPAEMRQYFTWHKYTTHYLCSGRVATLLTSCLTPQSRGFPVAMSLSLLLCFLWQPLLLEGTDLRTFRQITVQRDNDEAIKAEHRMEREILQTTNLPHMVAFGLSAGVVSAAASHLINAAAWKRAVSSHRPSLARYIASVGACSAAAIPLAILSLNVTAVVRQKQSFPDQTSKTSPVIAIATAGLVLGLTVPGLFLMRYRAFAISNIVATGIGSVYSDNKDLIWDSCKLRMYRVLYGAEVDGEAAPRRVGEILCQQGDRRMLHYTKAMLDIFNDDPHSQY